MAAEKNQPSVSNSEALFLSMATPQFNHDLLALIKSCQPLIYITTNEEPRFKSYMQHLSLAMKRKCFIWDIYKGLSNILDGKKIEVAGNDDADPDAVLDIIINSIENKDVDQDDVSKGSIYVLFGFDRFMKPSCDPETERRLKYYVNISERTTVILVGPSYSTTEALDKDMSLLDFPYPNDEEIKNTLYVVLDNAKVNLPNAPKRVKDNEEELIKACRGLTLAEAQQAYCRSVVMAKKTKKPEFDIPTILNEKKQIIRKNPILDYVETSLKISDVGGLNPMIDWLKKRKLAFQENASAYGLPYPKGVLLVGIPGGGKSLTAKATASLYELPLLRLDFGKMFNSLVGESERTARDAIKLAESLAPCIAGDSVVHDSKGNSYTIENIIEGKEESIPKDLFVYSVNEEKLRFEKTRVKAVVRHKDKKKMLRLTTAAGRVKVTYDHKMFVNRNGGVEWIEAKDLKIGDLLMAPKFLMRDTEPFHWFKNLSPNAKLQYKDKIVEDSKSIYSCDLPSSISIESNGRTDQINPINGLRNGDIYYVLGMIDATGYISSSHGVILYIGGNWNEIYHFCIYMSDVFGTEPSIEDFKVIVENKLVTDMLVGASNCLFEQEDEAIAAYLSGVLDSYGDIVYSYNSNKVKLIFNVCKSEDKIKIKKSLHVFGVLSVGETDRSVIITSICDIKKIIPHLNVDRSDLNEKIEMILQDTSSSNNRSFGFKLGSALLNDRTKIGISASNFNVSPATISKYENKDGVVACNVAESIADTIMEMSDRTTKSDVVKLVESDLVGVKLQKIDEVGEEWAYDLCCENNHNFFANNLLCHNCILWCDEVEKGLSGTRSSGSTDGGTTSRVVSTFLTWLQEKSEPVFVLCTANDTSQIPPEFMRAGRFDEVFFVDLPGNVGREQIFSIQIGRYKRDPSKFDLKKLSAASDGYSGAEIEKSIEVALFEGFADGERDITTQDILNAIKSFKPLSSTRKEDFDMMREWAEGRCVRANTPDDYAVQNTGTKKKIGLDF